MPRRSTSVRHMGRIVPNLQTASSDFESGLINPASDPENEFAITVEDVMVNIKAIEIMKVRCHLNVAEYLRLSG